MSRTVRQNVIVKSVNISFPSSFESSHEQEKKKFGPVPRSKEASPSETGPPGTGLVVLPPLSEAPGFPVVRLAFPESGRPALVPPQRGDGPLPELWLGFRGQRQLGALVKLLHLGQLEVHIGAGGGNTCQHWGFKDDIFYHQVSGCD